MTVPGVSAQNRQNYAQDLQLSVRGFGARSSFGVRGVRLYSDGIPGTMPDGQGQFSQFDLSSADHIEVLRGPFSALYGNSSGGVISIFTEDAKPGYLTARRRSTARSTRSATHVKTTGDERRGQLRRGRIALSNRRLSVTARPSAISSTPSCGRPERHIETDDSGAMPSKPHSFRIPWGSLARNSRPIRTRRA